ncbi:S24 family peptidase [Nubsella zeaxanthinifaciens]|uniref:S24 family peptidase n=1 Tax=Nubsella zeaxanthinifaciens TaxID=392412 RepID=UPI003D0316A1
MRWIAPTHQPYGPQSGHKTNGRKIELASDGTLQWNRDQSSIDLHRFLTNENCVIVPVVGNYMRPSGLLPNGWAIVDKSRKPKLGEVVAIQVDGGLIIRKVRKRNNDYYLMADDPSEPPFKVSEYDEVHVFGVVTVAINFINRNDQ